MTKRHLIFTFGSAFFLLFVTPLLATPQWSDVVPHCVLYYNFDAGPDGQVTDWSGQSNHAPVSGKSQTIHRSTGFLGQGIQTSPSLGAFTLPPHSSLDVRDQITLAFWVKPLSFGQRRKLVSKRNADNPEGFITIGEDDGRIYAGIGDGQKYILTPKDTSLELNAWQHIALTLDATDQSLRLYLNGEIIQEMTCPYEADTDKTSLSIGGDLEGTADYFDGLFDEFYIFRNAASPEFVRAWHTHMKEMLNEPHKIKLLQDEKLALYLPLDRIADKKVFHHIPGSWQGVLSGTGFYWSPGFIKGSVVFSDDSDRLWFTEYPENLFSDNFSVNMWIKPRDFGRKKKLFSIFHPSKPRAFFVIGADKNTLYSAIGDGSRYTMVRSKQPLSKNLWQMITVTLDRTQSSLKLYQGAQQVAEEDLSLKAIPYNFPLMVGSGEVDKKESFKGNIDELKVFTRILTREDLERCLSLSLPAYGYDLWQNDFNAIQKKCIAYYPFENDTAHRIRDWSGLEHSGTSSSRFPFNPGHSGTGLAMQKNSQALTIPSSPYFDTLTDFTLAAWVRPEILKGTQVLFSRHADKENYLILGLKENTLFFDLKSAGELFQAQCSQVLTPESWQHFVVTYSFLSRKIRFYLEGQQSDQLTATVDLPEMIGVPSLFGQSNSELPGFQGSIDEIKIFASELTLTDIPFLLADLPQAMPTILTPNAAPELLPSVNTEVTETSPLQPPSSEPSEILRPKVISPPEPVVPLEMAPAHETTKILNTAPAPKPIFFAPNIHKTTPYRTGKLFAYLPMEAQSFSKIKDVIPGSNLEVSLDSKFPEQALVAGHLGIGLKIHPHEALSLKSIPLRVPRSLSVQWSLFPLSRATPGTPMSLLTVYGKDNSKPILELEIIEDHIEIKTSAHKMDTNRVTRIMPGGWQEMVLVLDGESRQARLFKNNAIFLELTLPDNFPSEVTLRFGKDGTKTGLPCILDEIKLYRMAFREPLNIPQIMKDAQCMLATTQVSGSKVNVHLMAPLAKDYMISYNPDFIGSKWLPIQPVVPFKIKTHKGNHMLYCKFRGTNKLESRTFCMPYTFEGNLHNITLDNPIADAVLPGKR